MKQGHQQILWLYGDEHYITEVGTMNIMVFWRDTNGDLELVTPPIEQGVILPGVTRDSLLSLAREWGEFKEKFSKILHHVYQISIRPSICMRKERSAKK